MKKITICLIVMLTMVLQIGNVFASEEIPTFNCYLADYTINNSPLYDFYKNEYYGIYRAYVDNGKKNPAFQAGLVTWELGTFQLSDIAEENNRRVGFYETLLYDVMYQGHMNEPISDTYKEIVSSVQAKSLNKLCKDIEEEAKFLLKSKTTDLTADQQVKLAKVLQDTAELNSVFRIIKNIEEVIGYVNTVEELIDKLAKTEAIVDRVTQNKVILQNMKQSTTNKAFISAIDSMLLICDEHLTLKQVENYFKADATARELSEFMLNSVWSAVLNNLNGYGFAISIGQTGGKLMSNVLFSTDENLELFYSLSALSEYEDAMKAAMDIAENNYINDPTEENAVAFNETYKMLLQTHILGVEAAKKVVVFEHESGLINSIITLLTKDDYRKALADIDTVKTDIIKTLSFLYGDVYNKYIEKYGTEAEALGLLPKTLPTSEEYNSSYTFLSEFSSDAKDVTFSKDYTLTRDKIIYGNVSVTGGTLDLNGYELKVLGNLTVNGNVSLGTGKLTVNGNMSISGTINIEQGNLETLKDIIFNRDRNERAIINVGTGTLKVHGNCKVPSTSSSYDGGIINVENGHVEILGHLSMISDSYTSQLRMNSEKGYMIVYGEFYVRGADLTAGTLELKGSEIDCGSYGIKASGTHKTILSGEGTQKISRYVDITFNILIIQNENIVCDEYIAVAKIENKVINGTWKLKSTDLSNSNVSVFNGTLYCDNVVFGDISTINGTLYCNNLSLGDNNIKVEGDVYVWGNVYLNTGTLTVNGNMSISGTMNIEQGNLETLKDIIFNRDRNERAIINVGTGTLKVHGNCKVPSTSSSYDGGIINVENGHVEILGHLSMISDSYTSQLRMNSEKGYMLVYGEFYVRGADLTAGTLELKGSEIDCGSYGIKASGTHKTILSGSGTQTISGNYINFNILVNKNPNATFKETDYKYLFTEIPYTLTIKSSKDDSIVYDFVDSTKETFISTRLENINTKDGDGYALKGWYLDEEFSVPLVDKLIVSDMTIYAKWVQPIKLEEYIYSDTDKTLTVNVSLDGELKPKSGTVLIAVYGDNNCVIDVYTTNELESISHTFDNITLSDESKIKMFYWTDLKTLIPLCESISVTIE